MLKANTAPNSIIIIIEQVSGKNDCLVHGNISIPVSYLYKLPPNGRNLVMNSLKFLHISIVKCSIAMLSMAFCKTEHAGCTSSPVAGIMQYL